MRTIRLLTFSSFLPSRLLGPYLRCHRPHHVIADEHGQDEDGQAEHERVDGAAGGRMGGRAEGGVRPPSLDWQRLALGQGEQVYQQLNALATDNAVADSLLLRLARAEQQLAKAPVFTEQLHQRMQLRLLRGDTEHAADLVHYFLHISPDATAALHWAELNYQTAKEPDDEYLLQLSRYKAEQQAGVSE